MKCRRVAVIGGGLGGLSAASQLAREGCEVVLYEASASLGGKAATFRDAGLVADLGPTLLTMPDVVRGVFERMGASELLPPFHPLELQCAYRWPDGSRFEVHSDFEKTVASAEALRAGEGRALRAFYEEAARIHLAAGEPYLEAPFENTAQLMARVMKRGLGAMLTGARLGTMEALGRRFFASEQLRQFVGRFATYAGASPYEANAAFAVIPHLERTSGVHHVEGGMGALAAAAEQAARRNGVQVRLGSRATWTQRLGRHQVTTGQDREAFDAVVVNMDPLRAREELPTQPLALSGYVVVLELEGRSSLPHHNILFSADGRAEFEALFGGRAAAEPTLYVCNAAATDPSLQREPRTALYLMINAPTLRGDPAHDAGTLETLRSTTLDQLRRLVPGIRWKKLLAERTPADFAALGAPRGSLYGYLPHGRLGAVRRPPLRGKPEGVFFAGGGTHPGGGVPLVLLSGSFAADLTLQHLRGGR